MKIQLWRDEITKHSEETGIALGWAKATTQRFDGGISGRLDAARIAALSGQ